MESQQDTISQGVNPQGTTVVSTGRSEADRLEAWFYAPIEEQGEHRGFTILLLIIPIYERYLRHTCNYDVGNFNSDKPVIAEIMNNLSINRDQAFHFWQIMRNGLLHRSTPKEVASLKKYVLVNSGPPISEVLAGQLAINPYSIRPCLLKLFRDNAAFWSHSEYPVPDEVTVAYQPPRPAEQQTQTQPRRP